MAQTTRRSLLLRIKDSNDQDAWAQFVDIYGPLVFRFGIKKGLQEADASDMAQEVMQRVSGSIKKFEYDPSIGRFRSWLFLISNQSISNLIKKKVRQPIGSGDTAVNHALWQIPTKEEESLWESDYRQQLLDWAISRIKIDFAEKTWLAFMGTAIENRDAKEVAESLDMSVGAVYIARSRIMKCLKEKVATIDESIGEI